MRIHGRRRKEKGSAQIEFALSIVTIVLLIFSIFEIMMAVYTYTVIADAAKEAVRYASIHHGGTGGTTTCGSATTGEMVSYTACDYAKQSLHDIDAASVTVDYPDTGGAAINNRVTVTIAYTFIPYTRISWASPTLHAASAGRIVF